MHFAQSVYANLTANAIRKKALPALETLTEGSQLRRCLAVVMDALDATATANIDSATAAGYCTQTCLLALKTPGSELDEGCPNFAKHKAAAYS